MRKTANRTEKSAVAPATVIETLCDLKLPTMACIAEHNGQHHQLTFQSGVLNAPGPLASDVGHVALEWSWSPMIEQWNRGYPSRILERYQN